MQLIILIIGMEKEFILGRMAVNTKENITTIKKMGMEYIPGQMEESTKGNGDKANSNKNIYTYTFIYLFNYLHF